MTAVANPPSFANINRPAWGSGSQSINGSINHDDVRSMFAPRKPMQRSSSSSSLASNASSSSASSTYTVVSAGGSSAGTGSVATNGVAVADGNGLPITTLRKRPLQKVSQWSSGKPSDGHADYLRGAGAGGAATAAGRQQLGGGPGANGTSSLHQLPPYVPGQANGLTNGANGANGINGIMARPQSADAAPPSGQQPVLYLVSLNGTFERKTISVPFMPDTLRIGRQTNRNTTPNTVNGYFDSKVLSRQHAEIWADRQGKIWIRDVKSSNGTFVNGARLSAENRESEPHELQTNDHLELGIDIVSEDQKSVVHHKVAAKVEHAGFISASNGLLDINFSDLDPLLGAQMNGMALRARQGGQQGPLGPVGRAAPTSNMAAAAQANGMVAQRGALYMTAPSTEAIVKKIQQEMRAARQQAKDLERTQEFIKTLLSKDDICHDPHAKQENGGVGAAAAAGADAVKPLQITSGNLSFRSDGKAARFSDPPAPPPQQPLPEKPDAPSFKRGAGADRPKSVPLANTSPVRPDTMGQMLQLTDALNTAKREIVTQHTRLRELEDKLHREQEARRSAEALARRLEEAASSSAAAGDVSLVATQLNGAAKVPAVGDSILEDAFAPPFTGDATTTTVGAAATARPIATAAMAAAAAAAAAAVVQTSSDDLAGHAVEGASAERAFRARMDVMMAEMEGLKKQLQAFEARAERAEAERDAGKETLADMVERIRQRDEENARLVAAAAMATAVAASTSTTAAAATRATSRSLSRGRRRTSASSGTRGSSSGLGGPDGGARSAMAAQGSTADAATRGARSSPTTMARAAAAATGEDVGGALSRTNTVTAISAAVAASGSLKNAPQPDSAVLSGIPYASMVGVVLIGMGLMAYLNGWQPASARVSR